MNENEKAQELASAIRALGDVFVSRIPATMEEMEGELALIKQHYLDLTPWQNLHRHLHSMAGSAGTFGYAELGDRARELELRANEILKSAIMTTDQNRAHFILDLHHYMTWVDDSFVKNR